MDSEENWDLQIAISLLGLEFFFLTMMMDIPSDDKLFDQTKSFILPFFYPINLPDFIQTCIWLSFIFLLIVVLFCISPVIYEGHLKPFTSDEAERLRAAIVEVSREEKYVRMAELAGLK